MIIMIILMSMIIIEMIMMIMIIIIIIIKTIIIGICRVGDELSEFVNAEDKLQLNNTLR